MTVEIAQRGGRDQHHTGNHPERSFLLQLPLFLSSPSKATAERRRLDGRKAKVIGKCSLEGSLLLLSLSEGESSCCRPPTSDGSCLLRPDPPLQVGPDDSLTSPPTHHYVLRRLAPLLEPLPLLFPQQPASLRPGCSLQHHLHTAPPELSREPDRWWAARPAHSCWGCEKARVRRTRPPGGPSERGLLLCRTQFWCSCVFLLPGFQKQVRSFIWRLTKETAVCSQGHR